MSKTELSSQQVKRVILDLCIVDTGGNVARAVIPFQCPCCHAESCIVPTAEVAVCNIGIKAFPAAGQALQQAGTITRPAPALAWTAAAAALLCHAQLSQVALR